jgi:hypothetical protein
MNKQLFNLQICNIRFGALFLLVFNSCSDNITKPQSRYQEASYSQILLNSAIQNQSSINLASSKSLSSVLNPSSEVNQSSGIQASSSSGTTSGGITQMTLTASTSTCAGRYAPSHVAAIWVEDSQGLFVRSLNIYASIRLIHLRNFRAISGVTANGTTVDGYAGATRDSFGPIYAKAGTTTIDSWDLKNKAGVLVPNGSYFVKFEMVCQNTSTAQPIVMTSVPISIDGTSKVVTGTSGAGFTNIRLEFK